jgi:hypothetical protein
MYGDIVFKIRDGRLEHEIGEEDAGGRFQNVEKETLYMVDPSLVHRKCAKTGDQGARTTTSYRGQSTTHVHPSQQPNSSILPHIPHTTIAPCFHTSLSPSAYPPVVPL